MRRLLVYCDTDDIVTLLSTLVTLADEVISITPALHALATEMKPVSVVELLKDRLPHPGSIIVAEVSAAAGDADGNEARALLLLSVIKGPWPA